MIDRAAYDPLGRLVGEATPAGKVAYRHDDAGRLAATVLPDGTETTYEYDEAGLLASAGHDDVQVTATRDRAGRVTGLALPGGVTASYSYDQRGQLSAIGYVNDFGGALGDLRYEYDGHGRRSGASGSLAAVDLPTAQADSRYETNNLLAHHRGAGLTYDQAGNLLADGDSAYTWDARGQLVAVEGPVSAQFEYDPFGRRVAATVDGETTTYLYDGWNIAQQQHPDGSVATYLTGPGLDELYARTLDGTTHTYLTDVQGSVLGMVGPGGTLDTRYSYDPHGATTVSGEPDPSPFGYSGRERDPTGLYYYRNRYYHPELGRFISEDPLGFAAGDTNLYAYVFNDPVNHVDPMGLQAAAVGGCMIAGGAALAEANAIFAEFSEIMTSDDPFGEEARIAMDHLHRRAWDNFWAYVGACGASIAIPLPGMGAPLAGTLGRTAPSLTGRTPTLVTRQLPGRVRQPGRATPGRPPGGGRACSFPADTLVLMADGSTEPIGELEVGDLVAATDPVTGEQTDAEVTGTWRHEDTVVDLHTDAGVVTTTGNHPFWSPTTARWERADTLTAGDELISVAGDPVSVTALEETASAPVPVHNLTVADLHTYYVLAGDTPVLVHNAPPPGCRLTPSADSPMISSKTVWTNGNRTMRVDVENPSPGTPGSAGIHVQFMGRGADPTKYYYNPSNGMWVSEQGQVLSPRIARQIPQSAINRANQYLGIR